MGSRTPEIQHYPVLLEETLAFLKPASEGIVVDCTLGFGGHSLAVLEAFPNARVVAIDQDEMAIAGVRERLAQFERRIEFVHSNFSRIKKVLKSKNIDKVQGVIADLGVSSMQVDSETRGFSFRFDAPLDMRMDETADIPTAAELLASLTETEIANVIYQFGEERKSRRIASRIVNEREAGRPIRTTKQLADLVARVVPRSKQQAIHPATKTFQALRIKVNNELDILEQFLIDSAQVLAENGILAVITFHSLEDRIVKNTFQRLAGKCICPPRIPICVCSAKRTAEIVTRKPIVPTDEETTRNPRSRSAKMRVIRKIEN
jgi:16S rRNA (cytosine1402-N4)-methyltransferase